MLYLLLFHGSNGYANAPHLRYAFFASLVWFDVFLVVQAWNGIIITEEWIGKDLEGSDRGTTLRTVPIFSFECTEENHGRLKRLYKARKRFAHEYVGMLRSSYAVTRVTCSCHFFTQMAVLSYFGI